MGPFSLLPLLCACVLLLPNLDLIHNGTERKKERESGETLGYVIPGWVAQPPLHWGLCCCFAPSHLRALLDPAPPNPESNRNSQFLVAQNQPPPPSWIYPFWFHNTEPPKNTVAPTLNFGRIVAQQHLAERNYTAPFCAHKTFPKNPHN